MLIFFLTLSYRYFIFYFIIIAYLSDIKELIIRNNSDKYSQELNILKKKDTPGMTIIWKAIL